MVTSTSQLSGTRFQTVPRLRRIHVLQLALKLVGIGVPTYVVVRIAFGRPLYPVPLLAVGLLIAGIGSVCRVRVSWGTTVVFQDSEVVFLRDSAVVHSIPRASIQRLQHKKDSLTFRYQADRLLRGKVIGREGFPPGEWKALEEYATGYVLPQTQRA